MFHSRLIVEQVETRDYPSLFSRETFVPISFLPDGLPSLSLSLSRQNYLEWIEKSKSILQFIIQIPSQNHINTFSCVKILIATL